MQVAPSGRSSTSGVDPTRSSRFDASTLCTPLPDIDGRAELSEQLVQAPEPPSRSRRDAGCAVPLDQLGLAPAQACDLERVGTRVPLAVLEHPFSPFGAQLID